jgi:hypothetical protein
MENNLGLAHFFAVERVAQVRSGTLLLLRKLKDGAASLDLCGWDGIPHANVSRHPSLEEAIEAFRAWSPTQRTPLHRGETNECDL